MTDEVRADWLLAENERLAAENQSYREAIAEVVEALGHRGCEPVDLRDAVGQVARLLAGKDLGNGCKGIAPEKMTTIKRGKVVSYDRTRARGQVELKDGSVSFGATSFHSGRPTRDPRNGDCVEVVFAGGPATSQTLLYVRLCRETNQD